MAKIKGWTKTKKYEWVDKENRRIVWITLIPKSNIVYANAIYHNEGVMIFNKRFNSIDKALKYIMNYMKKHPRG